MYSYPLEFGKMFQKIFTPKIKDFNLLSRLMDAWHFKHFKENFWETLNELCQEIQNGGP